MIELGPLRLDLINDGLFELRPESFVKVSKDRSRSLPMSRGVQPRVRVGFNSLLIRGLGRTVLIDPGAGDKPLEAQVREYKMEWPRKLLPALESLGVRRRDIDTVVLTHLHWDHAGGSTTVGYSGQIEPTFPEARYFVQRRELDAARESILTQGDGYLADDFEPLIGSSVLELIDENSFTLFPWLSLRWTGGHCAGHQIAIVGEPDGKCAVYFADLVPTTSQLSLESGMSYDEKIDQLAASKKRFIEQSIRENYLALFVHAPRNRAGYLSRDESGKVKFRAVKV